MSRGFDIRSGWLLRSAVPLGNISVAHQLRKEADSPSPMPWLWLNWYTDKSYAATQNVLTFNESFASGVLDVNVTQVNSGSITGTGTEADPWKPGGTNTSDFNANVVQVNSVAISGSGSEVDPWGPA